MKYNIAREIYEHTHFDLTRVIAVGKSKCKLESGRKNIELETDFREK